MRCAALKASMLMLRHRYSTGDGVDVGRQHAADMLSSEGKRRRISM